MWNIGDTEILVDNNGKFFAEIDGKIVRRASLSSLRRLIEQDIDSVPVLIPDQGYSQWHIRQDEIIRVVGNDRLRGRKSTSSYHSYDDVYLFDAEALNKLKALLEEYEGLRQRWSEILRTMTRVTAKNLDELREQLET